MAIEITSATTFTQIHNEYKPGLFGRGEDTQIRGGVSDSGATQVYTHNPLMRSGSGEEALQRRLEKYREGAQLVRQAMTKEHGAAITDAVFQRISAQGRHPDREVTRGDLGRLQAAVLEQTALLRTQTPENQTRTVLEATVKRDAADTWPSDTNPAIAARLEDGRSFSLPDQFHRDFVERGVIQYTGEGELRLQLHRGPDGRSPEAIQRDNLAGVAEFIRASFGREPGTPEFDHVANNLLRYVQQGAMAGAVADIRQATDGEARLQAQQVRIEYRLSVQDDRVRVASTLSAPVDRDPSHDTFNDDAPDRFVGSSYRREDEHLIDARNLSAGGFDPLANQISASRTISTTLPRRAEGGM